MDINAVARIAIDLARTVENPVSIKTLRSKTKELLASPAFSEFEVERVVSVARSMVNVTSEDDSEIISDTGYEPWVRTRFAQSEKQYWKRYHTYLAEKKCLPPISLKKIDESTDRVLDLLRDPQDESAWDRRGLIVGDVQSGKTANYTGLICKAVDAGYKLVIILAGAHNNLRAQTQIRIDEGVLGFDTRYATNRNQEGAARQRIGVGDLPPQYIHPVVNSLTTSNDKGGDFSGASITGSFIGLGGDPNILCIKKNTYILDNVINWLESFGETQADGSKLIKNCPVLLIDDEADYASVNTADYIDDNGHVIKEQEPKAINRKIRKILKLFSRSAYVGYTATPFANIFIHNETKEAIAGEDLFPRSFIRNIHAPSNYIGADKFFGLGDDELEQDNPQISENNDAYKIFPPRHKKDLVVSNLPETMKDAIHDFFLACAVRAARGQEDQHNSMLIHVTRFTDVQHQVFELVNDYVGECLQSIRYDKESPLRQQLATRYKKEFHPDCQASAERLQLDDCEDLDWKHVNQHLVAAMEKLEVREINGSAGDVLDYLDNPSGLNVIAIGGDKLSRGLTLEGLTVSYFLRASRMYDTLLQMGRWFGYRPGYGDVCRLWTTTTLVSWFQHVARSMNKLREEFDYMASIKATPEAYGLRVATHPDGMMITGPAKMRAARDHLTGYNNTTAISTTFACHPEAVAQNYKCFEKFITDLQEKAQGNEAGGLYRWTSVSAEKVVAFLKGYQVLPSVITANTGLIAQYIEEMNDAERELTNWTVGIATKREGEPRSIGGISLNPVSRRNIDVDSSDKDRLYSIVDGRYTVKTVLSPDHEVIDLSDTQLASAKASETEYLRQKNKEKKGTTPAGPFIRANRDPKNGLLLLYPLEVDGADFPLIGFVVSFPNSTNGHVVRFKVNNVYDINLTKDMFDVD
jgi:hypothetical protein